MIHKQGKHEGCSSSGFGWSFSEFIWIVCPPHLLSADYPEYVIPFIGLPVNSTGLTSMPLPDGNVGFNVDPSTENTADVQWVEVMSKSDSTMLIVHLAGRLKTCFASSVITVANLA